MAVCSWLLSVIPNYGRSIYNQAQKVDYDKYTDQSGYPAGDGFEELTTYDEIKKNKYNYIIEVDAEDLTPISVYKSLQEKRPGGKSVDKKSEEKLHRKLEADLENI